MPAHDPDSVFEPIAGMLYRGTTKSRRGTTVKVLHTSPQTVLYVEVGRGAKSREKTCKSSRSKFIHCHEPTGRTPFFATVVAAEARAEAGVSALAIPLVDTEATPTQDTHQEAPVPATAAAPAADKPKRKPSGRYGPEEVREMYLLAVDIPPGKTRTAHQEEVAATYGCSETLIDNIVRGKTHAAITADLRARQVAPRALSLVPRADALPKAPAAPASATVPSQRPAPTDGRTMAGQGHATVAAPRHGDGPPPPPPPSDRAVIAEAKILLTDSAELIQTLARCVVKGRLLPTYLPMTQVEEMAARCEQVAERLAQARVAAS